MTVFPDASPPIVMTTDFGLSDAFVGVMKGVILRINPHATIIDLIHDIRPQDLQQGAFVLGVNFPYFPLGSIHVSVVDPGVGTERRAVVLETPTAIFVAPDNGLLSEVINRHVPTAQLPEPPLATIAQRISLPDSLRAYELTESRYRLEPVSNTFHGRDVFAPAAAHISMGVAPAEMGPRIGDLVYRPLPEPIRSGEVLNGEVVYVDRYGNLITNIARENSGISDVSAAEARVDIAARQIQGLSRTFHDEPEGAFKQRDDLPLVALFGSSGYLEVAVPDGNAAQILSAGAGTPVSLTLYS